jgi:mannitol operon transcriptional antiterminator
LGAVAIVVPLDSRQASITRALLSEPGPATVEAIATELKLTSRVVRYNLPSIETFLRPEGLHVMRRRGVGVWVTGDEERRRALLTSLDTTAGPRVLASDDRKLQVLADLLDAAPRPIHIGDLEADLGASRPTVRRDVRAAEAWLEGHHLHLQRLPGVGIAVRGSEIDIRKGLLSLLLEAVPAEQLLAQMSGTQDAGQPQHATEAGGLGAFASHLDLPTYREILTEQLLEPDDNSPMLMVSTLYLAIVARRVRGDREAELQSGQLRSLIDHPVGDAAARIAAAVEKQTSLAFHEADVAAITEFLLGFGELVDASLVAQADDEIVIDRLVASAASRLHPSLAEDVQLRRSLGEHLRRLRIRLRYGLPVTNPLDQEVRERYPDVYAVASEIVAALHPLGDAVVPHEEVGFLTMYLAGSLERNRLRPKTRVAVVCPAGMATAWILVSRLSAEFPNVEITRVVSKTDFEKDVDVTATDLVVSTVPLDEQQGGVQTVVVSPLLRERDLRRLSRILGDPAH